MEQRLTRRTVVTGLATGALVIGLDPLTRTWITDAHAATGPPHGVPRLDGRLVADPAALAAAADDFGHQVHRTPVAVLEPGSVSDIAVMLRYCRAHGLQAAPRGQGHATAGQAQVAHGLVIDMTPLHDVRVLADRVVAGAGARWSEVVRATLAQGLTPPVFTDYLELSVGGTLSVGGVGGASHHHGAQVDTVLELEVVTGAGDRVVCSPDRRPELFDAVRAGLGQCAVVVGATVRLLPAPATVRHYQLYFPSLTALTAAQRTVVRDGRFDYVEGQLIMAADGTWQYLLEAVAFFHGSTAPDDTALLGGLADTAAERQIADLGYFDFLDRLASGVAYLESVGEWARPHPWWNAWLPDAATDAFVAAAMSGLTSANLGTSGVVLLYPVRRDRLRAPLLRVPGAPGGDGLVFLFAVLRTASPGALDPAAMVAANGELFQAARAAGGLQYPVGSIPTGPRDWRAHYGPVWPAFAAARDRYDPAGVLTPGQGVFPP